MVLMTSSEDFHGARDFLGGIFTVLETSEFFLSDGDFFGGIFMVLETSPADFHGAADFF